MKKKTKITLVVLICFCMVLATSAVAIKLRIIAVNLSYFNDLIDDILNTKSESDKSLDRQTSDDDTNKQTSNNKQEKNEDTKKSTSDPDSDGDGYNDEVDAFPYDRTEWLDSDKDGYGNNKDAFPYDPSEWRDSDNDGYGDNTDKFPYDSSEWKDTDGDNYGDNNDMFPYDSSEWLDSDYDGHGDNSDAFPYDVSEWKDSDKDGVGDNSDPYPYDYDNDGYSDSVDIDKYRDVGIKISFEKFRVVDEVDWLQNDAEVYFEIYINERMECRIDNNGESFVVSLGQTKNIDDYFVSNIPDNQRYTDIRIVMWDDDWILGRELINIDGHDETRGLSIVYDAVSKTWSGDDSGSSNSWGVYTDGRDDGSWDYDDNDGVLWYNIRNTEVEYDKTYSWTYKWSSWSIHINMPRYRYSYYKHSNVNRFPFTNSQRASFVTSDDSVVVDIANRLYSLANNNGYDYYETVNFVLRFVQNLRYSYDNVSVIFNDYWRFPVETLVDETGDCEDTSILFASLMEAMKYDAVLFLPHGHVAVGILGYEGYPGTYHIHDGHRYYYCETTGEGWIMGQIPPDYQGESATIIQVE